MASFWQRSEVSWVRTRTHVTAFVGLISIKKWLRFVVLQKTCPPGPCDLTLFGERLLAEGIKLGIV